MAIARKPAPAAKPAKPQRNAEAFIRAAGKLAEPAKPVKRPFLVRMDDDLREQVEAAALAHGMSQSQLLCQAARAWLKKARKGV